MTQTVGSSFSKDFSSKVVKSLARQGIRIIGATALPDATGSYLNSERGYNLDDNGTHRICAYLQVVAIAAVSQ